MNAIRWPLARWLVLVATVALGACEGESKGFVLPPGDIDAGRATFVELQCNACHRINGVVDKLEPGGHPDIDVVLGGPITRVKTYGDLVTSIINPSHRLSRGSAEGTVTESGESTMRVYNDVMTVQQLVDLTAFLQETYSVWVPEYTVYHYP